jgi:hypothetical protein
MIRWYDYAIAFAFADLIWTVLFLPYVGFIVAYAAYEYGWSAYCNYRLNQEYRV